MLWRRPALQNSTLSLSLRKTSFLVIVLHVLLIFWMSYFDPSPRLQARPRVVVQTVALSPKKIQKEVPIKVEREREIEELKMEPLPRLEKQAVKAVEVKKIAAKPKTKPKVKNSSLPKKSPEKSKTSVKNRQLLTKAQESIAKIRTDSVKIGANLKELKVPEWTLAKVEPEGAARGSLGELSYRSEIAERLRLGLLLPEYGDVNFKLTLTREGRVAKLQVLETKSEKNRLYVEKNIPTLRFPPFGDSFLQDAEHTFTINLSHDL